MNMILDGRLLQEKRIKSLKNKVSKLKERPVLVIIQIGENKESEIYIKQKIKFGEKIGVGVEHYQLKSNVTKDFVKKLIGDFNEDEEIKGIIVQLPIPKNLDANEIIDFIDPAKDVDGLTSVNIKKLVSNKKGIVPATARGVLTLLKENKISVEGKNVVVIGRSLLVGRSIANLLLNNSASVTVCHTKTKNLKEVTKQADIIISGAGSPKFLKKEFFQKGQVVVDVGITFAEGKIQGDVDFEAVSKIVSAISPVPGGAGPMTVLSLFENLVD
jgi:methylenetetrahydrofolate dehydrogenase (NADP+)/methenyltetrahydrofolate cyclohydrolase